MDLDETDTLEPFDPEEAGIMLDRLAIELLHAHAEVPEAVPALKRDAWQLLLCAAAWLSAPIEPDNPILVEQCVEADTAVLALARTLQEIADHLLVLAELVEHERDPNH